VNLGPAGEKAAARFLRKAGYRILARNWRCPAGEIDLIAREGDTLVFVEVKTRRRDDAADPEINVTSFKRRQLTKAARYYLSRQRVSDPPSRFDVVAVVLPESGRAMIEHFIDAFGPEGR